MWAPEFFGGTYPLISGLRPGQDFAAIREVNEKD